ncbi:nitrogenase component 1 [Selenomonas montiformis]|nr:nitrogenase component 1 [Selenomonas montiformis]
MKGLRLYLPPFAPDTSGAASVLYPLGGMVIIVDAGGCAGNICGFDEPRWQQNGSRSAVFSAGLRDMDAIMGRDDKLIEKIRQACLMFDPRFIALIGTPVPAVIGTDYHALTRMIQNAVHRPAIAIDSNGTQKYDQGGAKALLALSRMFAPKKERQRPANESQNGKQGTLGVLGLTPLDFTAKEAHRLISILHRQSWQDIRCYDRLEDFQQAGQFRKNLVVSPMGLPAARFFAAQFDIPYEVSIPAEFFEESAALSSIPSDSRVLIVHQQIFANSLRGFLRQKGHQGAICCATFFEQADQLAEKDDQLLEEEDSLCQFLQTEPFDYLAADELMLRALPDFHGHFIPLPHFAASGSPATAKISV